MKGAAVDELYLLRKSVTRNSSTTAPIIKKNVEVLLKNCIDFFYIFFSWFHILYLMDCLENSNIFFFWLFVWPNSSEKWLIFWRIRKIIKKSFFFRKTTKDLWKLNFMTLHFEEQRLCKVIKSRVTVFPTV